MTMSDELKKVLQVACTELYKNAEGELVLCHRRRIWRAFGPLLRDGHRAVFGIGYRRRIALAIICVRHVLPIWEKVWPDSKAPHDALLKSEQYLEGVTDYKSTRKLQTQIHWMCDNYTGQDNFIAVGYAAFRVLSTALFDEAYCTEDDIDENFMDEDVDPLQRDASFYSAAAYANGAKWQPESSVDRRKEFWEWYLKEAVIEAWNSVE